MAMLSSTVVASCRYSGFGFWQKYGASNSSWIRMICAPLAAASRTSLSAVSRLASRSQEQAIWVAATVTIRLMNHLLGGGQVDAFIADKNRLLKLINIRLSKNVKS